MIVRPHRKHTVFVLLFSLRGSIVPIIWPRVVYTMLLSVGVVMAEHHGVAVGFTLNAAPLTLLGLTLAIFLGFRNNVAYQRWWEGRVLWGDLLISTRNLGRQVSSFLPTLAKTKSQDLVYGLVAYAHALRHHLRGTESAEDVTRWLPADVVGSVLAAPNRPLAVLGFVGREYAERARDAGTHPMLLAQMDTQINLLSHVMGGCERIQKTPIPFAYILLLHRTVHIYCFMLPFCLIGPLGWFTPVAVGVLAYTFFGLDAIGEEIEDPFDLRPNGLPLDAMCRTVEIDLRSSLGEHGIPGPLEPRDYVLS